MYIIICPIAIAYSMGQITRNSSGDEIANVNFLYDDFLLCTLKYNTRLAYSAQKSAVIVQTDNYNRKPNSKIMVHCGNKVKLRR